MQNKHPVRPTRHYTLTAPPREEPWPLDPLAQPRTPWHRLGLEAMIVAFAAFAFGMFFLGLKGIVS